MFDVITFGSATKDIFLRTKESVVLDSDKFATGRGVCFSLGSKIKADEVYLTSGGGGTNSAATLALQGFKTAYCGKIGRDDAGLKVLKDLEDRGVNVDLVSSTDEKPTNHSVIIDVVGIDRTILVYRGASDYHSEKDIDFENLRAGWFYIAPFSESSISLFNILIDYANENGTKVMVNPSKAQLGDEKMKDLLSKTDVLLLNAEEAAILTGESIENDNELIKKTANLCKGVVLITQGVNGVVAHNDGVFYRSKPIIPEADDKTGAGDSFGSGFLSEYIRTNDVEKALQFGTANSTACLQKLGAKNGLLKKDEGYQKNPVLKGSDVDNLNWEH